MDMKTTNTILHFGTAFPSPFTGRSSKCTELSKYTKMTGGIVANGRISSSAVKAIVTRREIEIGSGTNIAIGNTFNSTIVELKDVDNYGNVFYQIAAYETNGNLTTFIVEEATGKISLYNESSGWVALLALWESLYSDEEFYNTYEIFSKLMEVNDYDNAWNCVSILADNMYRVIKNELFPLNELNDSINNVIIEKNIADGIYEPTTTLFGHFSYLKTNEETVQRKQYSIADIVGKYPVSNRTFTNEELTMIKDNRLDETYIPDETDIEVCTDIVNTTGTKNPFRTFTFSGPPGTGKSSKAKAIANGICLPEIIFSCHPGTEIFDFVGQVLPPDMDDMEKESWNFAARIEELGGLNFKNIAQIYGLPTVEDITFAPEEVFLDITGKNITDSGRKPTVDDAVKAWTQFMHEKFNEALRSLQVSLKSGSSFRYVKAPFIEAVEKGYLIEVQEPTTVLNQGVFVGLNSILNEGTYTLQTGETIYRHPDNTIIFTTNVDLEGLNDMNISFLDRSQGVYNIQKPSISEVCERVMSISGNTDKKMVLEICKLCDSIESSMQKEGITDGICGIRSAINWATKAIYTNPYRAALSTVIGKTSLRDENQKRMLRKLDESYFFQFKNR